MSKMDEADTVFDEGLEAYQGGSTKQSNPYSRDSDEYSWWNKGWDFGASVATSIIC